jgi:acetyl esterase/lipase
MEYRLAPEDPYPAALDDCTDTYEWVVRNAAELGVDPARLVLGGASAGGGIAAAVALRLRDRGGRLPLGLQLMSPMLDDRMQYASSEQCASGLVWSRESSRFAWSSYLRDVAGDVPYTAAPGRAVDLAGLPSTLIDVGDVDMFRDEDVAFASALWAGGVNCELHVWPAAFHGSDGMAPGAAVTRAAKAARIDWFRRRLAQPSIESASSAESPLD